MTTNLSTGKPGHREEINFLLKCRKKGERVTDEVVRLNSDLCRMLKRFIYGINLLFEPYVKLEFWHQENDKKWDSLYAVQITSTDEKRDTAQRLLILAKEFVLEMHNSDRGSSSVVLSRIVEEIDSLSEKDIKKLKKQYEKMKQKFNFFDDAHNITQLMQISRVVDFDIFCNYEQKKEKASQKSKDYEPSFSDLNKPLDLFTIDVDVENEKINCNLKNYDEDGKTKIEECVEKETLKFKPKIVVQPRNGVIRGSHSYGIQYFHNDDPVGWVFENAQAHQKLCAFLNEILNEVLVSAEVSTDLSGRYFRVYDVFQADEETIF